MPTITLDFSNPPFPNANPATPPTGFTDLGAATSNVTLNVWSGNSSSANSVWGCDTVPNGDTFTVSIVNGAINANGRGLAIYNASGNGFMFLARNSDIRIFALSGYALSGSVLQPYTLSIATDKAVTVDVTQSTGTYVVKYDGSTVGTYVNALYTSGLRTGLLSRSGGVKSFSLTYTSPQTVNSINGGSPIENGQQNIPFSTTGFSGNTITSITTNQVGVTCSGIVNNGDGTGTFNLSDMQDGVAYPALPTTVTYTFSDGTNTAQITEDLQLEAGWSQVTYAGAVPLNDRVFCWHLDQAGISIADGTIVYWETTVGFAFTADGDSESDQERTVLAKVRDESTGLMSFWTVVINDAGEVVNASGTIVMRPIDTDGIIMRPLTMRGM